MPASSSPVPAPRGSVGRHALEGGAAVTAAAAMMSACGVTAALALGAQNSTALSRLVPALLSMAVGGHLTLDSGSAATREVRPGRRAICQVMVSPSNWAGRCPRYH